MKLKLVLVLGLIGFVAFPQGLPPGAALRLGQGIVFDLASTPEGIWVATALGLELWDPDTGELLGAVEAASPEPRVAAVLPGQGLLARGRSDGTVEVWDRAGHLLLSIPAHPGPVTALAFSPQGEWLASGGEEGVIRVWSLPAGELLFALGGHTGEIHTLAFSPDGRILASGSEDRTASCGTCPRESRTPTCAGTSGPSWPWPSPLAGTSSPPGPTTGR